MSKDTIGKKSLEIESAVEEVQVTSVALVREMLLGEDGGDVGAVVTVVGLIAVGLNSAFELGRGVGEGDGTFVLPSPTGSGSCSGGLLLLLRPPTTTPTTMTITTSQN